MQVADSDYFTELPFDQIGGSPILIELDYEGQKYRIRFAPVIMKVSTKGDRGPDGLPLFQIQMVATTSTEQIITGTQ